MTPCASNLSEVTSRGNLRSRAGMTLLEVLAAFLIFSMVFTVLVGSSQTGVRSQGLSARRLEANLVADRFMTDLEIELGAHRAPIPSANEIEEEAFTIRVTESGLADAAVAGASTDNAGAAGAPVPTASGASDSLSLLAAQLPAVAKYLRRYDVEVEWTEGARRETIARTTIAFDWEGAAAEFPDLFASGAPGAADRLAANGGDGTDGVDGSGDESSGREADRGNASDGNRSNASGMDPRLCEELKKICAAGLDRGLIQCPPAC